MMIGDKLKDIPLKEKIQAIILCCILFISITGMIGVHYIIKAYDEVLYESVYNALSGSVRGTAESLDQIDSLADSILSNTVLQEQLPVLSTSSSRAETQLIANNVYNELNNYLFNMDKNFINYISVVQGDRRISTYTLPYSTLPGELEDSLVKRALKGSGTTLWVTDYASEYGIFLVKELRQLKNLSFEHLGTLIINMDMESLLSYSSTYEPDYDELSYAVINREQGLYQDGCLVGADVFYLREHLREGYGVLTLEGRKVFAVCSAVPGYGWDFISAVSYDSIARTVSVTTRVCLALMMISIILVIISSNRILDSLTGHFKWLVHKMNQFSDGRYTLPRDPYDYSRRRDEIGQLHGNFNDMARKINSLIQENYISEMLKKEAQLKALESQMNPHFLYNTLNSITWRAKAIKADDISQITTSLGNLLRITLSKSSGQFTLEKELEIVESYMTIQKLRYTQKLEFQLDIPKQFLECGIPKLTIQPLLENAIRYGLEESSEMCLITVKAFSEEDKLMIEVKNAGSSFEDNLLDKLEGEQILPHGFGIGLLNIHKRLVITYGGPFGLTLYNEEDDCEEYAVARITIPCTIQGRE